MAKLRAENDQHLAARVGVSPRQVCRWRAAGGLSELCADRAAVRAGYHPGDIWPAWWTVPLSA